MLNQKDINDFETLKQDAMRRLPQRTILPVVNQRLYLNKDGSWDVRFMMSGYSMGKPTLRNLLKQFVFAVSGIQPTDKQVEKAEPMVLERLTESIRQSLGGLQTNS